MAEIEEIINELIKFRDVRDCEQFHNPKDLAIAINIEAGELLELFLWKNATEANVEKVKAEIPMSKWQSIKNWFKNFLESLPFFSNSHNRD